MEEREEREEEREEGVRRRLVRERRVRGGAPGRWRRTRGGARRPAPSRGLRAPGREEEGEEKGGGRREERKRRRKRRRKRKRKEEEEGREERREEEVHHFLGAGLYPRQIGGGILRLPGVTALPCANQHLGTGAEDGGKELEHHEDQGDEYYSSS